MINFSRGSTTIAILLLATTAYGQCPDPTPCDCREAYLNGCRKDGVYTIDPGCGKPFNVFCDMKNGGWTVFQSRMDGSEDFYRNWADYVAGFGQLKGEHWLGLEKIHCLSTRRVKTELKIDLADFEGNYKFAQYSFFSVGNSGTNYRLNIAGYTGTAGDAMMHAGHNVNGRPFSTKDNDGSGRNCAARYGGAGWFNNCHYADLNGRYLNGAIVPHKGVNWYTFKNNWLSLRFARMKLRFRD